MPFSVPAPQLSFETTDSAGRIVVITLREATPRDVDWWEEHWKPRLGAALSGKWLWREHITRGLAEDGYLCLALVQEGRPRLPCRLWAQLRAKLRGTAPTCRRTLRTVEALTSLRLAYGESRTTPGANLVYVEYISVAPWNLPPPKGERRIARLGLALMSTVHSLSEDLGWGGRIGLHSKPESEVVYNVWRFTPLERELTDDGEWLYFELSPGPFPR